jgi:hypothetical protein
MGEAMNFANADWLVSVYLEPVAADTEAVRRRRIVKRFMGQHSGPLAVSHIVLLEARSLFSRITGEPLPQEWHTLEADLGGRLHVERINWACLRFECNALCAKYAWKVPLASVDTAVVAAVKLAGGTRLLSFDSTVRVLASAEGLGVFPALEPKERSLLTQLQHRTRKTAGKPLANLAIVA